MRESWSRRRSCRIAICLLEDRRVAIFFIKKNHKDMAINNDTATVSVEINSEQAKAKLDQLRRDTKKFTDALEEARRTGDKVAM